MESIQINGQKIWGPPKGWVGPPPPHGTEVFVKNIPDDVFEDELYYLFSHVGKVYEVRLPVHWTGMNKGFAFVRFTDIAGADAAIEKLDMCVIREGRQLRVERSLDNTRLFLSAVPNDKSGEEIKADLQTVVENVKTVYVYPALENSTMFRGYAFVEFECHRDAAIAKRVLTPDTLFNLFERKCVAAWANPLPFLSKETLRNINILFMRNIPNHIKIGTIRMGVDSLIYPDNVHKVKRLNDYAFLTFKNHDVAERAMMKIKCNPFLFDMKAVHIEWAIPRELVDSCSAKEDLAKDRENYSTILKPIENYNGSQPQSVFEDYLNVKNLGVENKHNSIFQNKSSKFDFVYNTTEVNESGPKQYSLYNNNNSSKESVFKLQNFKQFSNRNNNTIGQNPITEYSHQNSENYSRNIHLKNWLQSLTLTDRPGSCSSSPTLTSPSTDSSTNVSWKLDESSSQFFFERGTPLDYDSKDFPVKTNIKTSQQIALF